MDEIFEACVGEVIVKGVGLMVAAGLGLGTVFALYTCLDSSVVPGMPTPEPWREFHVWMFVGAKLGLLYGAGYGALEARRYGTPARALALAIAFGLMTLPFSHGLWVVARSMILGAVIGLNVTQTEPRVGSGDESR